MDKFSLKLKLISPRLPNAIVQFALGKVPCTIVSHRKNSSYYLGKMLSLFINPIARLQSTGSANFAASIHSVTRVQLRKCTASTFAALMIIGKRFQILRLNNLMERIGKMPLNHLSFSSNPAVKRVAPTKSAAPRPLPLR